MRHFTINSIQRQRLHRFRKKSVRFPSQIRSVTSSPIEAEVQITGVDKLALTLEGNIRRYGRISRTQLNNILREVNREKAVSRNNSLLILRSLGSVLFDEHPDTRTNLADEIWQNLKQYVEMDVTHYNALLRVYLQNGHKFLPTEFLADLEANNITPNRVTFQRFIAQYCEDGDIKGATQILDHMKTLDLPINDQVFNSFITGHFRAGDSVSAADILNIMKQAGLEPSGDTYCALSCGYAEIGDMDLIKKTLNQAEAESVFLRPTHLLEILFVLMKNGHTQHAEEIISLLKKGPGFNQDAIRYINQLLSHGYDDIAYQLYLAMPKPSQMDQQETASGRFFLRALAKHDRPVEVVAKLVRSMKEKELNKDDISAVAHLAYIMKKTDYALEVINKMNLEGLPIRAHYFWPAICQYRDKNDKESIMKAVQKMISLCETPGDFILTMHEYVMPALRKFGETDENIQNLMKEVGFAEKDVNFAFFLHLLKENGVDTALEYGGDKPMHIIAGGLRPCLFADLQKTQNWAGAFKALKMCILKSDSTMLLQDLSGALLWEFLRMNQANPDWTMVEEVLDFIKDQDLKILLQEGEEIKSRFLRDAPGHLLEKLEAVTTAEGKRMPKSTQTTVSEMNVEELRNMLTENTGSKSAKKWLLIRSCAVGNIDEAEEIKSSLDAEGFVYPPIMIRQLAFMYAVHGKNIEKATKYLTELETDYPEYSGYTRVVLNVAALQAENGQISDALGTLKKYAANHQKEIEKNEYGSNYELEKDCETVLKAVCAKDFHSASSFLNAMFDLGYVKKGTFHLLEVFMDGLIELGDSDAVVTGMGEMVEKYKRAPKVAEVFQFFVNKEDPERLQKVVDLVTDLHGEMNILHHLIVCFVECGHFKKARKILETPGLRAVMPRFIHACDRFVSEKKTAEIEQLVAITKDMFAIDREEMLFQLIRGYVRENDMQKALNVLTMYEEDGLQPRDRTLRYLGKVLKNSQMEVPFEIPAVPLRESAPATVLKETTDTSVSPLEQEALDLIANDDLEKILDLKRRVEDSGDVSSTLMASVAEALTLQKKFPDFRKLCQFLGENGDVESLLSIKDGGKVKGRGNITVKNSIFHSYINSNRMEEILDYLEEHPEETPRYLSESGLEKLATKSPDNLKRLENLVINLAETKQRMAPLNMVWTHHFLNGSEEAEAILQRFPEMLKNLRVARACMISLQKGREDLLVSLADLMRGKNLKSLGFVYSYLMGMHCQNTDTDSALEVVQQLEADGLHLQDLRPQIVQKLEDLLREQNKTIPWDVTKSKAKADSSSDSDSDSDSSSDDEKR